MEITVHIRRHFAPLVVGITAVSLLLSGCSNTPADVGDAAAVAPIQVGLISPLSGPFADNGKQARLGTELCTAQINDAGGIKALGGAKIELVIKDTGAAAPAQVANQLQSMIDQSNLSAVIGAWASSYTLAASTVAEQAKVPMVTESFADDIVSRNYQYIFKIPAPGTEMGTSIVDSVLELANAAGYDISTAAIVADNTSSAVVSGDAAADRLISAGVAVPVREYFTPGLTEANSIVIKVLATDPQLIFVQSAGADLALLQRAFTEQGYKGPIIGAGSGLVATDYVKLVGEAGNGAFSSAGWNWDLPGDDAVAFAKAFTEKNPEFDFPGQEAGEDCAAIHIIAAAMEQAKSSDPQDVREALSTIEITEGPATILASGAVSFDDTGMLENTSPVIIQWQDGKPYTVFPKKIASRDAIFNK